MALVGPYIDRAAALKVLVQAITRSDTPAGAAMRTLLWLALPIAMGVVLGMSIASYWVQPIWDEQAWYLYAAGRALDGARLYGAEVVDVSPPLSIWMSEIPTALARGLGLSPVIGLKLCVAALIAGVLCWCYRLIRAFAGAVPDRFALWFVVVGIYVLGVYPAADLGQREHILVILMLPYLVIAAARIAGGIVPSRQAVAAGLFAALGISLKPHYVILLVGIEALQLFRRRSFRDLFRPEAIAIVAGGLAYCAAVWMITPAYVTKYVPMLLEVYRDFGDNDWATVLPMSRIIKIGGLIVVCAILARRLRAEPLITLFVLAGLAGAVAYILQGKAWSYQLLPEASFLRFAIGLILAELFLRGIAAAPAAPARRGVVTATFAASCLLAAALYLPSQRAMAAQQWSDEMVVEYLDTTASYPPGTAVLVLSPNTYYAHQVALDRQFVWPSRYEELWMLSGVMRNEAGYAGLRKPLAPARVADLARETRITVAEDLVRWQPAAVLVERCSDTAPCYSLEGLHVDLVEWFTRDAAFARAWAGYRLDHQLEIYDVYVRKTAIAGS